VLHRCNVERHAHFSSITTLRVMIVSCAAVWLLVAAGTTSALRQPWRSWHDRAPLLHRQLARGTVLRASDNMENGVSLATLTDTAQEARFLQQAITKWLDDEWIVQEVHKKVGLKVAEVYLEGRQSGMDDLGEVMLEVGTTLESFDMADAFVSGWDVANKVSDLLMVRLDRELCDCMGDMSAFVEESNTLNANAAQAQQVKAQDKTQTGATEMQTRQMLVPGQSPSEQGVAVPMCIPTGSRFLQDKITLESAYRVRNAQRLLSSEFSRYNLLRQFMDGTYCVLCCCVLCAVYCAAVCCVLCAVCCVLCVVCCVLCAVCCVLCAVYCVLCAEWCGES
jgi:hypothetical protein